MQLPQGPPSRARRKRLGRKTHHALIYGLERHLSRRVTQIGIEESSPDRITSPKKISRLQKSDQATSWQPPFAFPMAVATTTADETRPTGFDNNSHLTRHLLKSDRTVLLLSTYG
jgi:uncharacterized Zn-finger protein